MSKHSPSGLKNSAWEPVHDILESVEQAVVGGWYPARRLVLSGLAKASRPQLAVWVPEADVDEGPREFTVSFALPGVEKSDIHVQVTDNSLTVSGGRPEQAAPRGAARREMPGGEFLRRVTLPAEVKPETAKAVYRDGVLKVTVARARAQEGRSVKIE